MKKIVINEEELEQMNYNDIAYIVLEQRNKKMKIMDLFEEICKILDLDSSDKSHVADLFELLSTDKRFVMLEEGYWDLRVKHDTGMIIDNDEDEDEDMILEDEDEDTEFEDSDSDIESDDDVEEDDLSDLVIIDDTDDEVNM